MNNEILVSVTRLVETIGESEFKALTAFGLLVVVIGYLLLRNAQVWIRVGLVAVLLVLLVLFALSFIAPSPSQIACDNAEESLPWSGSEGHPLGFVARFDFRENETTSRTAATICVVEGGRVLIDHSNEGDELENATPIGAGACGEVSPESDAKNFGIYLDIENGVDFASGCIWQE